MYNKEYSKEMNELMLCAICQDFSVIFGDGIGLELNVVLRLREIENEY